MSGVVATSEHTLLLSRQLKAFIAGLQNRMVHRCGECNPLAFRTFLGLQLPEQTGLSVNADFWKKALVRPLRYLRDPKLCLQAC